MQKQKQKIKKPAKFASWISTFTVCMLFWLLLTWSLEAEEIISGVVVSAVVACFAGKFMIHEQAFFLFNPKRIINALVYCLYIFPCELVKANIAMAKLVLSRDFGNYKSGIIRVPAAVKSDYALAMVSNSITLTPGTITVDVAEDKDGNNFYYVHWMDMTETDREKAGEIIKGRMERWIGRIWQ